MKDDPIRTISNEIANRLVAEGRLIEAGFAVMRSMTMPNASPEQISDMRLAFFAGAQHLWGTMMNILDPGSEPTAADLKKMDQIHKELDAFMTEILLRRTEGQA